jgi:phosphodiesterase/alkaline phosphatase D-like protein
MPIRPAQRQFPFDALPARGTRWKVLGQQVIFGQLKVVSTSKAIGGG